MKKGRNVDNRVFAIFDRRPRSMSQTDICKALKIGRTKFSLIETLTYDDVYRIADFLGISKSEIFNPERG